MLFIIILIIVIYIIANSGQHGGQATTEHKANTNNSQYKSQHSGQVITDYKDVEREYIGRVGEGITKAIVSRIKECEYILTNLYIPTVKSETTEIDLVAFTNRGLLVLETKNYSGTIYGNENSDKWFASVYNQNNYFYNPLKQNTTHIKYLDKAVALNIPIYSIIVFSDRCSLEYLFGDFKDVYICKMSTLRDTIKEIFDENPACVPSLVLSTVHSRLEKFARPSAEVIRKHKEYVSNKY